MAGGLKVHTVLAEDPSSVPSTDVGWLTIDCSSRESDGYTYTHVLILALILLTGEHI